MWNILITTDGSDGALAAQQLLTSFCWPHGTQIRVLYVADPMVEPLLGTLDPEQKNWPKEVVKAACQRLQQPGVEVHGRIRQGDAAHEIIRETRESPTDLVVVGASGMSGLERFLVGSVALKVARHATVPTLIAREPQHQLQHVVLATDGSEHARHATELLSRLPLPDSTSATVVCAVRPNRPFTHLLPSGTEVDQARAEAEQARVKKAEALAAEAAQLLAATRKTDTEIRVGDPASEVLQVAEERAADLVVLGARGASLIEGLLLGSVADRVLGGARCSILIAH